MQIDGLNVAVLIRTFTFLVHFAISVKVCLFYFAEGLCRRWIWQARAVLKWVFLSLMTSAVTCN